MRKQQVKENKANLILDPKVDLSRLPAETEPEEVKLIERVAKMEQLCNQLKGRSLVEAKRRLRVLTLELERLRSCNSLWKTAEPLLRNTAATLGLSAEETKRSIRLSALLVLPALCRKDGVKVHFSGVPRTDGKNIWLGPIDLSHPAAPVYVFGHGIHERCHVVYSDYQSLHGLDTIERLFTNIFEDVRVDALGESDCRGYHLWRQALIALLVKNDQCALLANRIGYSEADLLCGWVHAELIDRILKITLPEGVLEKLRRAAKEKFGEDFCVEALGIILGKMPLKSTDDAVALAKDFVEFLRNVAELEDRCRRQYLAAERKRVKVREAKEAARAQNPLSQAYAARLGAEALQAPGTSNASKTQETLKTPKLAKRKSKKAEEITATPLSPYPARILVGKEDAWRNVISPLDDSPAMERVAEILSVRAGSVPDPEAVEDAFKTLMTWGPLRTADSGILTQGACSGYNGTRQQEKFIEAFDEAYANLTAFSFALEDVLKRKIPMEVGGFAQGYDVDDTYIDRAVTGDERVFYAPTKETARACAIEILVDVSGSLGETSGGFLRAVAARLEMALRRVPNVKCRTAVFPNDEGRVPALVSNWDASSETTYRLLRLLPSQGPTPISTSLFWGLETLADRPEPTKLLIVLTDGVFDAGEFRGQIDALHMAGIETATVVLWDPGAPEAHIIAVTGFGQSTRLAKTPYEVPVALLSILEEWRQNGTYCA